MKTIGHPAAGCKRRFLLLALTALCALPAAAQTPTVEILDHGLVRTARLGGSLPEETPAGKVVTASGASIAETTGTIPARIGVQFGILFLAAGIAEETVEVVWQAPPLTNPEQQRTYTTWKYPFRVSRDKPDLIGYRFDAEWELVPGEWTVRIQHAGRVLAEQSFEVLLGGS